MRSGFGHIFLLSTALLAIGPFSTALGATTGIGAAQSGKPLGTLWYPGPYTPPISTPDSPPLATPAPAPAPSVNPAPVFSAPTPIRAAQPGKPLGTLWYPGSYDPKNLKPVPQPTPFAKPTPAPVLAPRPTIKPLGTLWYPGPYESQGDPKTVIPPKPVQFPSPSIVNGPASVSSPAPATKIRSGEATPDLPIHLSADEMSFDQETGLVKATGNVEIINGPRRLLANSITYNQKTELVTASGNIQLFEPGGEKIFGQHMEVSGDLRDAVIETIAIILADKSRIAAVGARRSAGNITEMRKGVYSPCNLCKDDPSKAPLWQLKAVKIIHDKNNKTIEYRDAWLEIYGIPVAYSPYLSHPDPTVKRKSGFLAPTFGGSSDLGFVGKIPYYINISPQNDATVTALITGDGGSGAIGEYRHRFKTGYLNVNASLIGGDPVIEDDTDTNLGIRGHIDSEGRFDINRTWRWGFDLNRATDDTYLRRYGLGGGDSTLNSNLFLEGFRGRNYFSANAFAFQGLQSTDDPGLEPLILPLIEYNHLGSPDRFGGQTMLDLNFLSLTRDDGSDTRRLSFRPGWQLPFTSPLGDIYKLTLSLNGDAYYVNNLARDGQGDFSGFSSRLTPQAQFDWRFPFIKTSANVSQIFEPIVSAVYSPYGGNPNDIPNEDSTELEFDDTNLFSANKFSGVDKVEGGPRINYGLKWGVYGKGGGKSSFFIGQSWRPKDDKKTFATGSGLEEDFSDLVARVHITPGSYLNLLYRTRFAIDNFTPQRNELTFSAGVPAFRVGANYTFIDVQEDSEFAGREEINYSASSQLNRFWRLGLSGTTDLEAGETRSVSGNLTYENECVVVVTRAARTFFEDRDIEPTDQVTLNVTFKTLGEFGTSVFNQ
ncbi:MAG: LPS assembly protein LptD [Proteobacteria bacterium]|nr:LPS assembly protein LptD [Pseudomonadota bacterium]